MDDVGWSVLALTALTGVSLFYALNNLALRSYSYVKLQDAFKAHNRESRLDRFVEKNEQMIITCSLLRLIANTGILGVLAHLMIIEGLGFIWFFILAVLILSVFSFAVPYSWAKYMCENILVHTYRLLEFSAWVAAPYCDCSACTSFGAPLGGRGRIVAGGGAGGKAGRDPQLR